MAAAETTRPRPALVSLVSPPLCLGLAVVAALVLSCLPLSAPIGPMYWDVFLYYDAANRIFSGQIPAVDFFAPVGPLGYYLFAGWLWLFPSGQPSLLAHWSMLTVTAPLMALIAADVDRRSRPLAFALVLPFLVYAMLPFNDRSFYPYPGSDAFGIYNRQVSQLLYVLVSALLFFGRSRRLLVVLVASVMAALFFTKITGLVAGAVICLYAVIAGRLGLRQAVAATLLFAVLLLGLQLSTGLVSAYLRDISALVALNAGTLGPRLLQAVSLTFGIVAPAACLAAVSLFVDRADVARRLTRVRHAPNATALARLLNHPALWLFAAIAAGILFESQNTGSQSLIFLWPAVLLLLLDSIPRLAWRPAQSGALFVLAAATVLPTAIATVERATRAYLGAFNNVPLPNENLKSLGRVTLRPDILARAEHMKRFYADHQPALADLAAAGELPGYILHSDFDFQAVQLMATDQAIDALHRLEEAAQIHFTTMMALTFDNIFPYLMDRRAPLHIAIGADPFRAVPAPDAATAAAVRDVDIALYPKCPATAATDKLLALYAPMLSAHRRIRLDECFDAFVHPRFAGQLPR